MFFGSLRYQKILFILLENIKVINILNYQSCGEGINQISCKSYEIQSSDWLPIDCGSHPCKASLNLKNPSARDNGLFRCKIQPYKTDRQTLNIQLIKTFKLEVIDSSPELLDDLPANVTSFLEGQV